MDSEALNSAEMPFSTPSATGQEVQLMSKYTHINIKNKAEFIKLALNYR